MVTYQLTPKANNSPAPTAPGADNAAMRNWPVGFGKNTGVYLPRSPPPGPYPTLPVAVLPVGGQRLHRPGLVQERQEYAAYVQADRGQDCRSGWQWDARPGCHRRHRQRLLTRDHTPATSLTHLLSAPGQRRHAYSLADLRCAWCRRRPGKGIQAAQPAVIRPCRSPWQAACFFLLRTRLAGVVTQAKPRQRLRRLPAQPAASRASTCTGPLYRQRRHSVFASFRACNHPRTVCGLLPRPPGTASRPRRRPLCGRSGQHRRPGGGTGAVPSAGAGLRCRGYLDTGAITAPPCYITLRTNGHVLPPTGEG